MSVMFLPAPTTPVHPSLTLSPCTSYACACVHLLAAWLLQQRSVWRQWLPSWSSSIHFECCGKTCSESLEVRSHLWCYAERATLAPYCATNQLQDLPSRAQLSGGVLVQFTYPSFATRWAPRLEGVIFVLLLDQFWSSLDTAWNAMVDEASQLWGRICGIYFPWMYEIMRSDWTFSKRS